MNHHQSIKLGFISMLAMIMMFVFTHALTPTSSRFSILPSSSTETLSINTHQLKMIFTKYLLKRSMLLYTFNLEITTQNALTIVFTSALPSSSPSSDNINARSSATNIHDKAAMKEILQQKLRNRKEQNSKGEDAKKKQHCEIEIRNLKVVNGELSYSDLSAPKAECEDEDTRKNLISQLESFLATAKRYQPLLRGVDVNFGVTTAGKADFKLSLIENADDERKGAWFIWTFLTQEILPKGIVRSREPSPGSPEKTLVETFEDLKSTFIYKKLFNSETAGRTTISQQQSATNKPTAKVPLSSHQLDSLMEMMHDFFKKPSFQWFLRVASSWFNIFCDIASCGNYVNAGKIQDATSPVLEENILKKFPCKTELSSFVEKQLRANSAIPILYFLMKNPALPLEAVAQLESFFAPLTKCFWKDEYVHKRYAEDGKIMNLIRKQLANTAKTGTFNRFVIQSLALGRRHFAWLIHDIFQDDSNSQIRQEVTKFASGLLFGYRLIEHIEYSNVESDIKGLIFVSGFQLDTGFHPLVIKDLLGIEMKHDAQIKKQELEIQQKARERQGEFAESFVDVESQDASDCFMDKNIEGGLNLQGAKDKCRVVTKGNFFPKHLEKTLLEQKSGKKNNNNNNNNLPYTIQSLEKDSYQRGLVDVGKYSPLTLNETWKVYYDDVSCRATVRFPLSESLYDAGYRCKLLHKKCWNCTVVEVEGGRRQFVEITNGVVMREFVPNEQTNRCLDCARAAQMSNDGGDGTQWRCTLQCEKSSDNSNNADL